MDYYILKDKQPVKTTDIVEWGKQMEQNSVEKTEIGHIVISTVFLGIDHNYSEVGEPILFETMIFGEMEDGYQKRYRTWDEAFEGHRIACEKVVKELTKD